MYIYHISGVSYELVYNRMIQLYVVLIKKTVQGVTERKGSCDNPSSPSLPAGYIHSTPFLKEEAKEGQCLHITKERQDASKDEDQHTDDGRNQEGKEGAEVMCLTGALTEELLLSVQDEISSPHTESDMNVRAYVCMYSLCTQCSS